MTLLTPWGSDAGIYSGQEMRLHTAAVTGGRGGVSNPADMKAVPQGSPDNTVRVPAGTIIIPATFAGDLGSYELPNDANLTSPAFDPTSSNPRWDLLLAQITSGSPATAALVIKKGTASGSPAYPSLAGETNYEVICGVKLPASASIIDNAGNGIIEDRRSLWSPSVPCTSTTRPPIPWTGQRIVETDTGNTLQWNGATWVVDMQAAWSTYTPAVLNFGHAATPKTVLYAKYTRRAKRIHAQGTLIMTGSGAGPGSGIIVVDLPVTAAASAGLVGSMSMYDSSLGLFIVGVAVLASTTQIELIANGTSGGYPTELAVNDQILFDVEYEAAAF